MPEEAGNDSYERPLADYAANVYSQAGEDGVIAEIFKRIGTTNRWCVEFGAWDGQVLSNSRALLTTGWSGVLIEGDPTKAAALSRLYETRPDVVTLPSMVGWAGDQQLDRILSETQLPNDFDLLSIDIDGNDYHVWASLVQYRPRLVVIEFNPTIPNGIDFVQPADPAVSQGSSIDALVSLGRSKGYSLVAALEFNAFFVPDEIYPLLGVDDNSIDRLRTDTSWQSQIFFGFDGRAFLRGSKSLYWHGVPVPRQVRVVPRALMGFPGRFGPVRKRVHAVWRYWRHGQDRLQRRAGTDQSASARTD